MIQELNIIHRRKPHTFTSNGEIPVWATCLRSLAFAPAELEARRADDEVYSDNSAYRFLLEVVCGLHSPVVGETEVFGQFKVFSQEWLKADPRKAPLVRQILSDAKAIRNQYLRDLGAQSYGSWVRKNLKAPRVHILGAGILVREILPYLVKEGREVVLHARDVKKIDFHAGEICEWLSKPLEEGAAVLVAAPVGAREIEPWLTRTPCQIFDLREDSNRDVICAPGPTELLTLHGIFNEIEQTKGRLQPRLEEVRREIRERSEKAAHRSVLRPLGWDDICA